MDEAAQLEVLAAEIITHDVCHDLAEQATQLVMGDGRADADIVLIGEAPEKNKDLQDKIACKERNIEKCCRFILLGQIGRAHV